MEHIRDISLHLFTINVLQLKNIIHVPSMRRNLLLVVALKLVGYSCHFGNGKFDLLYNSYVVGFDTLFDGLYQIIFYLSFINFISSIVRKKEKRKRVDESSLML